MFMRQRITSTAQKKTTPCSQGLVRPCPPPPPPPPPYPPFPPFPPPGQELEPYTEDELNEMLDEIDSEE